jgi:hypothetical protein
VIIEAGHLLSRVYGFYFKYSWYDILLHVLAGVALGLLWLWISRNSNFLSSFVKYLSLLAFAVLGSFLWEIWEYTNWRIFPWTTVYIQDVADILGDIFSGLAGGAIVAIWHFARHKI